MLNGFGLKNEKGFTLIEVVAVLIILGILAVVAIPKYIELIDSARNMAAQVAISEVKIRLSQAQSKYMMVNGGKAPNGTTVYTYATTAGNDTYESPANLVDVGPDFNVFITGTNSPITITVDRVQNQTIPYVVGYFNAAGD